MWILRGRGVNFADVICELSLLHDAPLRPEVEQPHALGFALLDDSGALRRNHGGLPVQSRLLHSRPANRLMESREFGQLINLYPTDQGFEYHVWGSSG